MIDHIDEHEPESRVYRTQWSSFDFCFSSVESTAEKFQYELLSLALRSRTITKKDTGELVMKHLNILSLDRKRGEEWMPSDTRALHPWHVFGELEYTARGADWQAVCQQFHRAQRPPGDRHGAVLYYPVPPRVEIKPIACKIISIVSAIRDECENEDERREYDSFLDNYDIHGGFHVELQRTRT